MAGLSTLWTGWVWTTVLSWHTSARCILDSWMPWARCADAWGRACQSASMHVHACTHAHTHAHARTHTHTHTALSLSCHIPMKMASGEVRMGARSFANPLEGQSRGAPAFLHPQAIHHTCCTALTRLPAPNLVFPRRWHMYQAEQEMSWVGSEQLPDRCHLQSAQACLWCVNYSINQHIALSGCQHLITSETLPVNGVKYVYVHVWMTGHTSCYC